MNQKVHENLATLVREERLRQDKHWGEAANRDYTHTEWLAVLVEEVGEVSKAINEGEYYQVFEELIQVAAVALAFAEAERVRSHREFSNPREETIVRGPT